jgi:hypothetical protein
MLSPYSVSYDNRRSKPIAARRTPRRRYRLRYASFVPLLPVYGFVLPFVL